jgi:uncharacterized protein (TIGR02302 family)
MQNLKRQLAYFCTLGGSFFTLLLERLWNSFWPLMTIIAFYAGLSLTQVVLMFGNAAHIVFLGMFTAAAVFAGLYLGAPFRLPRRSEVERRIELESGLRHRPLDMMHDQPISGTSAAAAKLFNREKEARKKDWDKLKIWRPRSDAPLRDRFALRHAALLFLIIGLVMAQQDIWYRLSQGLRPHIAITLPGAPVSLDIWAQPPGYTGKAPVFLATAQLGRTTESAAKVPVGSLLKIRIGGTASTPKLTYADQEHAFTQAADKSFTLEIPLMESGTADIKLGWFRKLGQWPIEITPDTPPAVSLLLVTPTERAGTKIIFDARDDYGVKNLSATITPVADTGSDPWQETLYMDVPFIRNATTDNQNHTLQLARHPMAGSAVRMTLTAEDDAGNISVSKPEYFVLPERKFENPTAARLNFERKRLTYFNNGISRKLSAQTLADIANRPHFFDGDPIIFLGLVIAVKRLGYDGDPESVHSVRELLWDLALRVEEGGLAQARDELTEALQKMSQALNNPDASEEELQQIMQEVAEKMRAYMQALANQMRQMAEQQMKDGEQLSPELSQRIMQQMDMDALMQQMQNMTDEDARRQMQDLMEQLRRAVENATPEEILEMQQRQAKATKAMNDLQKVIHAQQELVDQANKSDGAKEDLQEMGDKEGGLRQQLDQITQDLGQGMPVPESLGEAGDLMEQAQQAFDGGNLQEGGKLAKAALDKLQEGMDQAVQFMAEQMKQIMISFGGGRGQGQQGQQGECPPEERDPLGNCPGKSGTGSVKIPDEKERRRVQEIIRELRGRSNNWERPRIEREYIDRLLNN